MPAKFFPARRHPQLRQESWSIGCITLTPLWQFRPFMFFWLNELRATIQKMGGEAHFYHGARLYSANGLALAGLVEQNPHACWVLLRSTRRMQLWFQEQKIPVVIAGSPYEGVHLPSIDSHYRAIGRHAAGTLFARGHRDVALIGSKHDSSVPPVGVLELEEGMREGFDRLRRRSELRFHAVHHRFQDKRDVCRTFDRLLNLPAPPTGMVISHSDTILTITGYLFPAQTRHSTRPVRNRRRRRALLPAPCAGTDPLPTEFGCLCPADVAGGPARPGAHIGVELQGKNHAPLCARRNPMRNPRPIAFRLGTLLAAMESPQANFLRLRKPGVSQSFVWH